MIACVANDRRSYLCKDLVESFKDNLLMKLVAIELQPFYELFDRTIGLEGKE
jgi:hypothetical protein